MPSSQVRFYRPAIFGCSVAGCSRSFKSEPALKRHQTNLHIVPEALRPRPPNTSAQDAHIEPPHLEDTETQLDEPHVPQSESAPDQPYDGFSMERHPILDGEYDLS